MDDHFRPELWTRRRFIARGLAAGAFAGLMPASFARAASGAQAPTMLERLPRPQELETPVEYLDTYDTPNEVFFVRSHFGPPAIDRDVWRLEIQGMVRNSRSLSLGDLRSFPIVTIPATLQCAGNGRSLYSPKVPGVQWSKGGVGNAEWTGVRLRDVLAALKLDPAARHMQSAGFDLPPMPATPRFIRSIPIERALDPTTLLAFEMNGEPLPLLHGGPCRLVVPGWAGDHWLKWIGRITLQDHEAQGFYMQTGYRISGGNQAGKPPPVTANRVKSLIARPLDGAVLIANRIVISGIAFTGTGAVDRVEVSIDGGAWMRADLDRQRSPGAWQQWRYAWNSPPAGAHTIAVRAADTAGNTQPDQTPWNKSGYLWNGIDRIRFEVRS